MLRVQALLHTCSEHFADKEAKSPDEPPTPAAGEDKDKKEQPPKPEPGSLAEVGSHQAFAVLGLALIAMGEGIGSEMALRTFNHLVRGTHTLHPFCMHYVSYWLHPHPSTPAPVWGACDQALCPFGSLPGVGVPPRPQHHGHTEQVLPRQRPRGGLQRYPCHGDHRSRHQQCSFGWSPPTAGPVLLQGPQCSLHGPTGTGEGLTHTHTCCGYAVLWSCLLVMQGLTHLGKGTLTLNPFHSHQQLMSPVAVGGLLAVLTAALDCKNCEWVGG